MFELNYQIQNASPVMFAVAPQLAFELNIQSSEPEQEIHNVLLQCQLQIETTRRRYSDSEKASLVELYGEPERWNSTLRTLFWTHANVMVPPFCGETTVTLNVPCTFDFNVATTKYFHGLEQGDIPIEFLFSGTIFYQDDAGPLRVARIAWEKEAKFRLPVAVWKQMIDHYYPNSAWFCLQRDTFERLYQFKCQSGSPTWEQAIDRLLRENSNHPAAKNDRKAASDDCHQNSTRPQPENVIL